ncbi:MAG: hypothetical protein AAFV59_16930 [Pseudomonadota bacterium]
MKKLIFSTLILVAACSDQSKPTASTDAPEFPIEIEGLDGMNEEKAEAILGSINPLENDLRGLEVAIRMHYGFRIKPDGAVFQLGVTDGAGETRLDEEFILTETTGITSPSLQAAAREGFYIRTYKLDAADYDRMHAGDLILQELKRTAPGENQLKFNAGAYTCADPNYETPDEYRFAMFVRSAPDVDFVPLSNGDVVMSRESAGPLAAAWEPCET